MRGKFLRELIEKPKPWGREIWFAWTDQYAGKILEIKKGHRFSLQLHAQKTETQFLMQGKAKLMIGSGQKKMKTIVMEAGDKVDIFPGTIHRLEALEDSLIFEVSTPELDDVIKLDDDYGRTGQGNDDKLDAKLSKKIKST